MHSTRVGRADRDPPAFLLPTDPCYRGWIAGLLQMFNPGLSDLDSLVLRCRNGKAKSYLAEAVACLKAGAFRAAIVVTWVAVVHDVLAKLDELAHGGDANAQRRLDEFHRAVATADLKSKPRL